MATLVVTEGPVEGQKFALDEHQIVMVGRDHGATFQVLDPRMSRYHLQVKRSDSGHAVVDFESSNGVFVDGAKIDAETELKDGSLIRAGNTGILYSAQNDPNAQTITQLMRRHGEARFVTELNTGQGDGQV
jgi:pSer/pThr/pTyr-binding forkhead associated (FHA) protein